MSLNITITKDRYPGIRQFGFILSWGILAILTFVGCRTITPHDGARSEAGKQQVFDLEHINSEQCIAFLSQMDIDEVSPVPGANAVSVTGSPEQLHRAGLVLDLVDVKEDFVIEKIGPASMVRTLPSNSQIAAALGEISIGTFTNPPQTNEQARGIIDIQEGAVLAILPARHREQILGLLRQAASETVPIYPAPAASEHRKPHRAEDTAETCTDAESIQPKTRTLTQEVVSPNIPVVQMPGKDYPHKKLGPQALHRARPEPSFPGEKTLSPDSGAQERTTVVPPITVDDSSVGVPRTLRIILKPAKDTTETTDNTATTATSGSSVELQNGEDILDLDLPETMTLMQLLDLAGEYLYLNYVYDSDILSKQSVTLKLHGSLQGEMKVKDLYTLLETVLKFKGFAMTRREDKLVTIVPAGQALDVDPQLVDVKSKAVQAGDMVVTRVFKLQHVDIASVTNLLQNMKLGVAVSPSEDAQILFVTCYAHRMGRIEQLVSMLDRPGKPRECWFRRLQYTAAPALANKVRTLAQELQGIPVAMAPAAGKSSPQQGKRPDGSGQPVYLDTDERTNRILMIGYEEQLALLEELIDALDIAQVDLRILKVYSIQHLNADEVKKKLEELETIGTAIQSSRTSRTTSRSSSSTTTGAMGGAMVEQPQVVVLAATNSLLINATEEQHTRIVTIISYVDVVPEDLRTFKVYDIEHLDAEDVKKKLEELEVMGNAAYTPKASQKAPRSLQSAKTGTMRTAANVKEAEIVVLAATNSLLINATEEQHARIAKIISFVDTEVREQAIPYEIYFLENQEPQRLAGVLEKVIQETITNKEGKVEKVIQRTDEQILVVPDEATFSLIVYANKKNQEWISKLIKTLDRRRPQVLIDVTLVEIRKTDEFDYDLNLISSFPDLAETGGQMGSFLIGEQTVVDKLLQPGMRDRFIDLQANAGSGTGFYADRHVNALLQAIQTKNYGRVLAKPKILVNDNESGTIKTTDTTYVTKKSSIPVVTGAAGQQSTLIETAIDYEAYEAGITLGITPHISEGDLLRLEINLSRSDFVTTTGEKPPDQTSSDVNTVVTVPDGSTIILGGMLKLNQSKGGSKVPILGDLPLVGGLFRSSGHSDIQSKLYVFVRAEIIRPAEALAVANKDLERISDRNRAAFEKHEEEFQNYQDVPGLKPRTMDPAKVLEAR